MDWLNGENMSLIGAAVEKIGDQQLEWILSWNQWFYDEYLFVGNYIFNIFN